MVPVGLNDQAEFWGISDLVRGKSGKTAGALFPFLIRGFRSFELIIKKEGKHG